MRGQSGNDDFMVRDEPGDAADLQERLLLSRLFEACAGNRLQGERNHVGDEGKPVGR